MILKEFILYRETTMFDDYFDIGNWKVKSEYNQKFISLWTGWLGEENCHKLDEVTEEEWNKFNTLIRLISKKYKIFLADFNNEILTEVINIEYALDNYEQSMNKLSSEFYHYVIPELNCVIEEHWDYTYIIWYKQKDVIQKLASCINEAGLHYFG